MTFNRFLLIALVLLVSPFGFTNQYSFYLNYNKTQTSPNGGQSLAMNVMFDNKLNAYFGYNQLGNLLYQESFGLINYQMSGIDALVGFSVIDSNKVQLNTYIGSSFGLSNVSLSNVPAGHDGWITRAFYPSFKSSINAHYYLTHFLSANAGYTLQMPSLGGDQPWMNHWYVGLAFHIGKPKAFKSHLVFDKKVQSVNILKKIKPCQLCVSQFYSLLIGEFKDKNSLINALEHPKLNALLSTHYYLNQPESFFYIIKGGKYYLYFGEFKKPNQSKKWFHIFKSEFQLNPKIEIVNINPTTPQASVISILDLIM